MVGPHHAHNVSDLLPDPYLTCISIRGRGEGWKWSKWFRLSLSARFALRENAAISSVLWGSRVKLIYMDVYLRDFDGIEIFRDRSVIGIDASSG